mgnify:CR=1 FL=1
MISRSRVNQLLFLSIIILAVVAGWAVSELFRDNTSEVSKDIDLKFTAVDHFGVDVSESDCLEMFNRIVDSRQTNKSSMAFDVVKHRKTEIDFISGAVSKIGKKHGIKTPLNDLMYNIIKIKEGMYV